MSAQSHAHNNAVAARPRVLIVESVAELGTIWQRHLQRQKMDVACARTQAEAIAYLAQNDVDIIILDLVLEKGAALAVSDYANYRRPEARVVFVTDTTFFSDGSIFAHCSNARAFLPSSTPPEDLVAMIEHYGSHTP